MYDFHNKIRTVLSIIIDQQNRHLYDFSIKSFLVYYCIRLKQPRTTSRHPSYFAFSIKPLISDFKSKFAQEIDMNEKAFPIIGPSLLAIAQLLRSVLLSICKRIHRRLQLSREDVRHLCRHCDEDE